MKLATGRSEEEKRRRKAGKRFSDSGFFIFNLENIKVVCDID